MIFRRASSSFAALFLAGALLAPHTALTEPSDADKAQARELVGEGLKALRAGDFQAAFREFSSADKLFHAPTTLLGVARAQAGLKHLVAAQEAYNRLVREPLPPNAPEAFVNAVEDGKKELEALTPRIPSIIITVTGAKDPQVTLDGEPVSANALGFKRPVDPGKHLVKASATGFAPAQAEVTAVEGAAAPVPAALSMVAGAGAAPPVASAPPPPMIIDQGAPPPPLPDGTPRKTYAYVALGVGGAGLVVGVVTGIVAMGKKKDLDGVCSAGQCPDTAQSTHDSYKTMGLVSTIGFAAALVGGGAGAALLLTAPRETAARHLSPVVGWNTVGLRGSF